MKVFGLLSYWDERPDHLARCVGSLAGFCDHLIAVDGAYAIFPPKRTYSAFEQGDAIWTAANDGGISWAIYPRTWASEVEKRAAMFEYAREEGATSDDWLLVIDADETLAEHAPDALDHLAATDRDVAELCYCGVQINGVVFHKARERRLYRALPGLTVERAHWLYTLPGPPRRFPWRTPDGHVSDEPALDLFGHVTMHHHTSSRDAERRQRALDYYKARDAAGIESVGDWRTQRPQGHKPGGKRMQLVYNGVHPEVVVDELDATKVIRAGEPVDIPDDLAARLLNQDTWAKAPAATKPAPAAADTKENG